MSGFDPIKFIDECAAVYKFGTQPNVTRGNARSLGTAWDKLSPGQQDKIYTYIVSTADELIYMRLRPRDLFVNYCVKIARFGRVPEPEEIFGTTEDGS